MACGSCWQPRTPRVVYGGKQPTFNMDGMVALAGYPGCTTPYSDPAHRSETLYIVGWSTDAERVFTAARSKRAYAYAASFQPRMRVDPVLATQLCDQAVLDAYAAAD